MKELKLMLFNKQIKLSRDLAVMPGVLYHISTDCTLTVPVQVVQATGGEIKCARANLVRFSGERANL